MPNPIIETLRLGLNVITDTMDEIESLLVAVDDPRSSIREQHEADLRRLDDLRSFQLSLEAKSGRRFGELAAQARTVIEAWEKMNASEGPRYFSFNLVLLLDSPPIFPSSEREPDDPPRRICDVPSCRWNTHKVNDSLCRRCQSIEKEKKREAKAEC